MIAEVLFALIMNEYKSKIEKQYIIEETIVTIPTTNSIVHQRITTSLESIGLKNIIINPLNYEYQTQGEILQEILEKNNTYNKYKSLLEKTKQQELNDNTQPMRLWNVRDKSTRQNVIMFATKMFYITSICF